MKAPFSLASAAAASIAAGSLLFAQASHVPAGSGSPLRAPGFHHLHLNTTNPDAAIEFYTRQFPDTKKATVFGLPALATGHVYVLFTKVSTPPATQPQSAFWHFGWHVVNSHQSAAGYKRRPDL